MPTLVDIRASLIRVTGSGRGTGQEQQTKSAAPPQALSARPSPTGRAAGASPGSHPG
jgi:hypothetical protein